MADRKVALVIAGGVSLGSYEAGVLTELLYILDSHNHASSANKYVIDVITGGSAGSINGALIARILMHGYDKRNILHDLWVDDADVMQLMKHPSKDSLFSNRYQQEMGDKYLDVSDDLANPANFAPQQLKLSFSLSNMVGVDYGFPYNFSEHKSANEPAVGNFSWTFFSDQLQASINKNAEPDLKLWNKIKQGSMASGGFPVAFAPSFVKRTLEDFPGSLSTTVAGMYGISDGGMFDNEPVRQAIKLAAEIDGGQPDKDRVFILIDPNVNTSKVDSSFIEGGGSDSLFENIKRLLVMAFGEAEAKDWLRAGKMNRRLKWRDALIDNLPSLINSISPDLVKSILNKQKVKCQLIVQELSTTHGEIHSDGPALHLQQALKRLSKIHDNLLFDIGLPGESEILFNNRRDVFLHMLFEINSAGSLTDKSPINLFLIGANRDETAGEELFSLSGFFEKDWREHDYRLGRRKANELIPGFLNQNSIPREPGVSYDNDPSWSDFRNVKISDANRNSRKAFCKRVMKLVESVLMEKPFNFGWASRTISKIFISTYVRRTMGL